MKRWEVLLTALAFAVLLIAQWSMSRLIPGANYYGGDGMMTQTSIMSAIQYGAPLQLTMLNPLQGIGSQLLPSNVWLNPVYWPFHTNSHVLVMAPDLSALIALAFFAAAILAMMLCFDTGIICAVVAAMCTLVLFAPAMLIYGTPSVFCLNPGLAAVYAPHMVALGLLTRLERWDQFAPTVICLLLCLLLSALFEPMWTVVHGFCWSLAFAVIAFGKAKWLRIAALVLCAIVIGITIGPYLWTLSEYTARVQFKRMVDRAHWIAFVRAASPFMNVFYFLAISGCIIGAALERDRRELLCLAALATFAGYVLFACLFLLLPQTPWSAPIPYYVEHAVIPLYICGGVVGWWALGGHILLPKARNLLGWTAVFCIPLLIGTRVVHAAAGGYRIVPQPASAYAELLTDKIALQADGLVRGSLHITDFTPDLASAFWRASVPTVDEYSQLVTPPAFYVLHSLLGFDVRGALNSFYLGGIGGVESDNAKLFRFWQLFGVRYVLNGIDLIELPRPNLGNYSPTRVVLAQSPADMTVAITKIEDLTQTVVLDADPGELSVATDMALYHRSKGYHVSAHGGERSMIVLPVQFSHCLSAPAGIRLVKADLLLTGVIFSGSIDADIDFDYGMFSPGCRFDDMKDARHLEIAGRARD